MARQRVALVTGASRGIGRATALLLAERGNAVAVHYGSNADAAAEVVRQISDRGGTAFAIAADLGDVDAPRLLIDRLTEALEGRFGDPRFDILVNNAGIATWGMFGDVTPASLALMMQVNFTAPFFLIQHALPQLRDGGRIVNVSSVATQNGASSLAGYGPTKAALDCLTLTLARDLGPRGITVNSVRPGTVATDLNPRTHTAEGRADAAAAIALGRVGEPDDIAEVIAFLASDAGRWITGQHIVASGGMRL
jgi:3-oxoacyl-[acyl-carrier protein] reductase